MFKGKKLLLVDDVATTGTTIQECSGILQTLNPHSIEAFVLAHSFKKNVFEV
ncbi:MAG: phosphoribosyltransferase [Candidatus Riflebacteria bacterium]|nr:phosphoribosyltransferase [Candidatus Riflebacteria bacterium]